MQLIVSECKLMRVSHVSLTNDRKCTVIGFTVKAVERKKNVSLSSTESVWHSCGSKIHKGKAGHATCIYPVVYIQFCGWQHFTIAFSPPLYITVLVYLLVCSEDSERQAERSNTAAHGLHGTAAATTHSDCLCLSSERIMGE